MFSLFIAVILSVNILSAQPSIPEKVTAELTVLGDPKVSEGFLNHQYADSAAFIAHGLESVTEGKFKVLDKRHRQYIARIRLLRLLTTKNISINSKMSNSRFKEYFQENKITSFWLWMSRDEYIFPSKEDQAKLIAEWTREVKGTKFSSIDMNLDINIWWF
ncbi:MAG: hypothetical protein P4L51_00800 [Puia sp.]|nr:hypothetical protein [Puia sp.]